MSHYNYGKNATDQLIKLAVIITVITAAVVGLGVYCAMKFF